MNALFVIVPYKYEGMWVFDDPAVGLVREPFIASIDKMIDKVIANIPNWNGDGRTMLPAYISIAKRPGTSPATHAYHSEIRHWNSY